MKVGWSNCSVLLFAEQKSCCDVPGGSIMRAMSWQDRTRTVRIEPLTPRTLRIHEYRNAPTRHKHALTRTPGMGFALRSRVSDSSCIPSLRLRNGRQLMESVVDTYRRAIVVNVKVGTRR